MRVPPVSCLVRVFGRPCRRPLHSGEWLRFHTSGIDKGIEDQIRRDKREILLYRNRFKNDAAL